MKQTAEETFQSYRQQTQTEFDGWVQRLNIGETLNRILDSDIDPFLKTKGLGRDYRCTVHVPDILFEDGLYQLIDYLPSGGGRGRTWSVRYGMMGKQWRRGQSDVSGEIPTEIDLLIRDWGMTRREAQAAGHRRQSMACAVLQPENRDPVGIFYLDSPQPNAFGDAPHEFLTLITQACLRHGLVENLATLREQVRMRAPLIRIYTDPVLRLSP